MTIFPAFLEGIGSMEMLMIMFVVLLLFGADRLPELARGMGKSMREFKKAASGFEAQIKEAMEEEPEGKHTTPPPPPPPASFPPYPPGRAPEEKSGGITPPDTIP